MHYLLLLLFLLSGCASQTRLAVNSLDEQHAMRRHELCRDATTLAPLHDDIQLSRSVGSPLVLMAAGTVALVPVLLVNMGLDALDRLDASHVNESCGLQPTPLRNIAEQVILGGGFNLFTSNLKPVSN